MCELTGLHWETVRRIDRARLQDKVDALPIPERLLNNVASGPDCAHGAGFCKPWLSSVRAYGEHRRPEAESQFFATICHL